MNRNSSNYPNATAIITTAILVLLIPWLGETLFNSKGEPREAIVAVSMLQSGDWILPVNYGGDIPFKPPFLAWLIAVFAKIFNGGVVNEFISRLPSAFAAFAMTMTGYFWARRIRGTRFAMIFALVTITSFEVFRAAMACRLDMVLTACMVMGMYMLYDLRERHLRYRGLRYATVIMLFTCATLTKGPIGSLLPCFVMGVYSLLRGDRFFPTLFRMLGIALAALVIPAWWCWEAYQQGGQHFLELSWEENFGRLFSNMSYESHENPFWYNFLTILAGMTPWTLLALLSLGNTRHFRRRPLKPAGLLSATAFVLIVGFYCIPASKRSVYLLPAYPFICYGLTCLIEGLAGCKTLKAFTWIMSILAVTVPLTFIALHFFPLDILPLAPSPWWRYIILLIPVVCGIAWMLNRHSPTGHALVIVLSILLAYSAVVMPAVLNPRSDAKALPELTACPDTRIYSLGEDIRLFTLNYYLDDTIRPVATVAEADSLPSGSIVLFLSDADSTGISRNFDTRMLLKRNCDFRHPLYIAIRK